MRPTIAHIPVFGAIIFTMAANASYAIGLANAVHGQALMVMLALTIDIAKATFLPAAAHAKAQGKTLGALLLLGLWFPALTYSTYAGYAYLTTTRATAHLDDEAAAGVRDRTQTDYGQAKADLATAKASADWKTSAACTRPQNKSQRTFCANVQTTQKKLDTDAALLTAKPLVAVNPEVALLVSLTGLANDTVKFLVTLFPAVLIELLAGLGLYALRAKPTPKAAIPAPPAVVQTSQPNHQPEAKTLTWRATGATSA
jgi:hypothetical protein